MMTGDMREEEVETAIKVVIVGNGAVGKSSLIQRYCKGIFTKDYKKTIGVDFLERQIEVNGEDVRLMLWDTAGQEEFDSITKAYYRGAQACVVAYSLVDRVSFEAIESWKQKVEREVGPISTVLVQNKMDLQNEAVVTQEESEELANRLNIKLFQTSVKDNLNVNDVFRYLAESYLSQLDTTMEEEYTPHKIGVEIFATLPQTTNGHTTQKLTEPDVHTTIQLHPSKRRTQGKKTALHLPKCSLL